MTGGRFVFLFLVRPVMPFVRAVRLSWRCVVALVTLPVVAVDERVTRINLMRTETQEAVTRANLNVAKIGEILRTAGKSGAGNDCLDSVIRAVIPKPLEAPPFKGPVPFPRDLKTKGDA